MRTDAGRAGSPSRPMGRPAVRPSLAAPRAASRGGEASRPVGRLGQASSLCGHCGLPVPAGLVRGGEERQFCCLGCRQVYTLVHEWGFDEYYRLLRRQDGRLQPPRVTGRTFEDFDDERVQGEATEDLGGERRRTRLYLEGVHCAACVWLVEKLPAVLRGVDEVRLNLGTSVVEVTWRPAHTRLSGIARALDRLGYTPHVHRAARIQEMRRSEDRASLARLGVAAACAMNLMFLHGSLYAGEHAGMAAPFETLFRWLSLVVAMPVMLYSARPFFRTALAGVRAGMVHIDLPVAIGLSAAFAGSAWNTMRGSGPLWFDSLAMLVAALLGARQLQRGAQRAALERADSLRGAAFLEFARRLDQHDADRALEVPIAALAAGDRVEVRSGELVPADGVVLSGRSSLDNAVLTGETSPAPVGEGDEVYAGATNLGARLVIRVAAAGARTRMGTLLAVVEDALSRKPALLQATDRLARWFVQALLLVAAATGTAWWSSGAAVAVERVVALLVVACPCALGLSIPLAVSVTLMRAARAGIFVKNPDALERLRNAGTVLLDKTGTVTEGQARVVRWQGDLAALEFARMLEAQSAHAVARAFQRAEGQEVEGKADAALERKAEASPCRSVRVVRRVEGVVEVPGQGISGWLDEHDVRVGNRQHVEATGTLVPGRLETAAREMMADGQSAVFVAVDGAVAGVAGIGDRLRPDAPRTIAALRARGIRVGILSGDHPDVVRRVGADLGLDEADAVGGLTPEAKRDIVGGIVTDVGRTFTSGVGRTFRSAVRRGLQAPPRRADLKARAHDGPEDPPCRSRAHDGPEDPPHRARAGGAVVMVGDGVNDAAALALADVGIAVHGGMGATIVAADIVLTREGVAPVVEVLDGARRLRGVIRRNVAFSVAYNAITASLAVAGLVTPLMAAVLMPCSSLVVVLSSALTPTFAGQVRREPR